MKTNLTQNEIRSILERESRNPFEILGPHIIERKGKKFLVIRSFAPQATKVEVIREDDNQRYPMTEIKKGLFEVVLEEHSETFPYQLRAVHQDGSERQFYDAYSFPPLLADFDLYLMKEGCHHRTYEKLGAHLTEMRGVKGVYFALWAPNAQSVCVIGSFNNWDPQTHPMRNISHVGVWEIFIPGAKEHDLYKYQITTPQGMIMDKTDPHGFFSELSPNTASIVYDLDKYQWHDQEWLKDRGKKQSNDQPIAIYEVHLGSWRRKANGDFFSYREIVHQLVEYVKEMHYTHVELLPIYEHPFYGSWGYQVIGHYAPTSRYGTPDDFMYFVDVCHQNGIGVILDWVPAHFPKDAHGLGYFDGTHLYEHADPRQRDHLDWDTFIYNYGRNEVKNFLISNALFWLDKYHIDGLRIDAVASMLHLDYSKKPGEWIPNKYGGRENLEALEFLKENNRLINHYYPDTIVIAEDSTSWPSVTKPTHTGGLGFDFKWNMGWMNDTLKYMGQDPIFRKYHHSILAFSIWYAFDEKFILPLSHDEVVHGKRSLLQKMPGDVWKKFANLRLLFAFMYTHPGKKMLFMGGEFGQWNEWNHDKSLDWHLLEDEPHQKLQNYVKALNRFYQDFPALYELKFDTEGFDWIDYGDADLSVISFFREGKEQKLVVVCNFTPLPRYGYTVGVPQAGYYREVFNSDAADFWGSNVGNMGGVEAHDFPRHNFPYSLSLTLPPLGMIALEVPNAEKIETTKETEAKEIEVKEEKKEKEEKTAEKPIEISQKEKPEQETQEPSEAPEKKSTSEKASSPKETKSKNKQAKSTTSKKGKKRKSKKEKK